MKKTLLALATVASLGMTQSATAAVGDIGTGSFQWAGTVPATTVGGGGYWLVTPNGTDLLENTDTQNGILKFENKDGVINLVESSPFVFKVVKDRTPGETPTDTPDGTFQADTDTVGAAYFVSLQGIQSGTGGLLANDDQDGYFTVTANGNVISATADHGYDAGAPATIKIDKASTKASFVGANAGDVWQVAAQVAVSTATL